MEQVNIHKNGTLSQKGRPVAGKPFSLLGHRVAFDDAVTLASVFKMIRRYPGLRELSPMLEAFLEIIPDTDPKKIRSNEIVGLVFFKTIEIVGFPGNPSIEIFNSLHGRTETGLQDLKFFHLESLLGHQLQLGQLRHIIFGDKQDVFMFDTFYTLFELIEGIAWELSFNFNPLECSIRR